MPPKPPDQIVVVRKGMNKGGLLALSFTSMGAATQYMLKHMHDRNKLDAVVQNLDLAVVKVLQRVINTRLDKEK